MRSQRGFTLIETMLAGTILILVILAGLSIYNKYMFQTKEIEKRSLIDENISLIRVALDQEFACGVNLPHFSSLHVNLVAQNGKWIVDPNTQISISKIQLMNDPVIVSGGKFKNVGNLNVTLSLKNLKRVANTDLLGEIVFDFSLADSKVGEIVPRPRKIAVYLGTAPPTSINQLQIVSCKTLNSTNLSIDDYIQLEANTCRALKGEYNYNNRKCEFRFGTCSSGKYLKGYGSDGSPICASL